MTAPDMESIIAAALVAHLPSMMCAEGNGFYVECRCGAIGHIESVAANDWEPANQWSATHQARAVLDAISEAGKVEWGVEYADKSPRSVTGSIEVATAAAERFDGTVITRVTFPWERAE